MTWAEKRKNFVLSFSFKAHIFMALFYYLILHVVVTMVGAFPFLFLAREMAQQYITVFSIFAMAPVVIFFLIPLLVLFGSPLFYIMIKSNLVLVRHHVIAGAFFGAVISYVLITAVELISESQIIWLVFQGALSGGGTGFVLHRIYVDGKNQQQILLSYSR